MKMVFLTNYYNHHQKPLADAFYSMLGDDYYFVETEKITEERLNMGWGGDDKPPYVLKCDFQNEHSNEDIRQLINDADVVMLGHAPQKMVEERLKKGGLVFLYRERLYKSGLKWYRLPLYFIRHFRNYIRFKNLYVLCASAYTPLDFSRTGAFVGKTYKWGYFPEVKTYDNIDALIDKKTPASILWAGRHIDLKHPELAIEVAKKLKDDGYTFVLNIIGTGVLENVIRNSIESNNLGDCVKMLGSMKPEQVREHMENSEIFLFTSDRNEGWGAVLNESMNSACAVVANSAIGSVPFLMKDGENGYMYNDGDVDMLYHRVKQLLKDTNDRKRIAKNAYSTIAEEWNAENAAKKFISLCEKMLSGEYKPFPYDSGVCSKAKILKDNWMK